jgi:DNA invertase Pin-like site-specific DNA recombinase
MAKRKLKKQPSNRTVGYVRRSTDRQEQSIPDQKKAIEAYACEHALDIVKFYVDDAISGTSTLGRRAFNQMIEEAQSSNRSFDKIIVYDVKRFGRIDNDQAGYFRYILKTNNVELLYVTENFNGDTTDDLLRPVKQWLARQESKDLSKVTIRGLLSKSQTGSWLGGVPPYGYDLKYHNSQGQFLLILRFMPDGSKQILNNDKKLIRTLSKGEKLIISKRDYAKLIPGDPERIKIIKQIFQMYMELGKGYKSIAYTLNNNNVASPRNSHWSDIYRGKWTDTTIRAIIVNPIYAGDMVWNRRTDARFHKISNGHAIDRKDVHGARLVPNDTADWIIVRDAHPALISRRVFETVKDQHKRRKEQQNSQTHGKTWNGKRSRFILSGLLRCSLCGNRYQGFTRIKGKRILNGAKVKNYCYFYYVCGGYITKGKKTCNINTIPQEELESKVIEVIVNYYKRYLQKGGSRLLSEIIRQQTGSEKRDFITARQRAENKLNQVNTKIDNLLDNITESNRKYVDRRLNDLDKQRRQIELRLDELDKLSISQTEIQSIVTESIEFISNLEFILNNGVPQEKLSSLRQCIEKIWINKPDEEIKLIVRRVPKGNIQITEELTVSMKHE